MDGWMDERMNDRGKQRTCAITCRGGGRTGGGGGRKPNDPVLRLSRLLARLMVQLLRRLGIELPYQAVTCAFNPTDIHTAGGGGLSKEFCKTASGGKNEEQGAGGT
jgi:hypothetical protein